MAKKGLTHAQRMAGKDLWIITIVSFVALGLYAVLQEQVVSIVKNRSIHILSRILVGAAFQFALAGLGIVIVSVIRRESLFSYGLKAKGAVLSICLCSLCFVPIFIFMFLSGGVNSYLPFQSVLTTKELLENGFPLNVVGMAITSAAWGFFGGFNYVVICDKINKRYPSKYNRLDWGATVCAVLCVIIHGAIGVTAANMIEMLSIMIVIYGMLMVKKYTGNAWGCIFVFVFLWNAF